MSEELQAALDEVARLTAEVEQITGENAPVAQLPVLAGGNDPAAIKRDLAASRALVLRKQQEAQAATERLREVIERQLRDARQMLEPLQKQAARLTEAISSLDLYTGRDEEIVTLCDGAPADAGTPITIRSMVLAMDEECAIDPEGGGIDARHIEQFDDWLLADRAHLDQVLPEPRGVVVLVPTLQQRSYGDPWTDRAMREANAQSYWLIRNGDRLFRMDCPFNVGRRLIGSQREFTELFYEQRYEFGTGRRQRVALQPGTHAWEKAQEAADARTRHYMKVALVLQGLIDRTTVFHPLPHPGLSLLSEEAYTAGYVKLVEEEDLAIDSGREPFFDWLKRLNAQLRPGMRVVGAFNSQEWTGFFSSDRWSRGHERVSPRNASYPQSLVLHTIEDVDRDGYLIIRYQRTDEVWKRDVPVPDRPGYVYRGMTPVPAARRASARLHPNDRFIIPIDLATEAEMLAYLQARTERHAYLHSFPLLKAAIAVKRAEAAEEAPFRVLLAAQLVTRYGVEQPTAEAAVEELVTWWKFTNTHHRPLVGNGPHETKALKMIVEEYGRRSAVSTSTDDPAIVNKLRAYPDVMVIARDRRGHYVALAPQPRAFPAKAAATNVFCRERVIQPKGRQRDREWVIVDSTRAAKWRVLWHDERWSAWNRNVNRAQHLTDPQLADLTTEALEAMERLCAQSPGEGRSHVPLGRPGRPLAVTYVHAKRQLRTYRLPDDATPTPTGPAPDRYVDELTHTWARDSAGDIRLKSGRHITHTLWNDRTAGDDALVWSDPDAFVELAARNEAYSARRAAEAAESRRVENLVATIETQHDAAVEADAYARFLEDYRDPDLWEGHRKTLRLPHMPIELRNGLRDMLAALRRAGVAVNGRTVAEALGDYDTLPEVDREHRLDDSSRTAVLAAGHYRFGSDVTDDEQEQP